MESELSPDKDIPPVPIKTYQWEDLRRARRAGGYPWTHLLKPPLEGEITAEDILRETTPRRSMSREVSRSRTNTPVDYEMQKILNLDSSPGSSRKYGEDGDDEGVHIPNFSKEISLEDDDASKNDINNEENLDSRTKSQISTHLFTPIKVPTNVSPKSILKRKGDDSQYVCVSEVREKTKCCHPLVNKIKHLADRTLQKLEKNDNDKSPHTNRKNDSPQEIRQLKTSPGAVRRQKFCAIKLGDSDEMSKTLDSSPPQRKRKEHIYEDIEEATASNIEKTLQFSPHISETYIQSDLEENKIANRRETESLSEKKSVSSQDPSLINDDAMDLKDEDHIMEKIHKIQEIKKEALVLDEDDDLDSEEPNVDEIFQNQLEESMDTEISPHVTITEITEYDANNITEFKRNDTEASNELISNYTKNTENIKTDLTNITGEWSKNSSDHEYEVIEKPTPGIVYTVPSFDGQTNSSTMQSANHFSNASSLEKSCIVLASDDEELIEDEENNEYALKHDEILTAEELQQNIEDRYFSNTPSSMSRTECEISTSQVDSSALEILPLKRDSRQKTAENIDSKIQQRIREGTGKLKNQAGKLKSKLQSIKANMPERPKINFPERPKFKMPDRPKINFPDKSMFSLPDRRKFSLPDRPKTKKIVVSEKLQSSDRKKFTFPDRPKINMPDMPKFKLPDRPKINFGSLGRKKDIKPENIKITTVEYETRTYPRLFGRKKKTIQRTTSSPMIEDLREDTPPPIFTFTRMKTKDNQAISNQTDEPREYGVVDDDENNVQNYSPCDNIDETYDFDKIEQNNNSNNRRNSNENNCEYNTVNSFLKAEEEYAPREEYSPKEEYTHIINEINNDEFFVRPRGISRENIQVREYLSDEIRQAFKIPKNTLAMMSTSSQGHMYANDIESDPDLLNDDEPIEYNNDNIDQDDGYYTFPPVRPSRVKRKKKELESVEYIDENVDSLENLKDIDYQQHDFDSNLDGDAPIKYNAEDNLNSSNNELSIVNLDTNNDNIDSDPVFYNESVPIQAMTLPMPPRRKKKSLKSDIHHSSLNDIGGINNSNQDLWQQRPFALKDEIIVYRTEHEYIVPEVEAMTFEQNPLAPRRCRNRSRSSIATSVNDDDRTSHGADSLTLDTQIQQEEETFNLKAIRAESPGYATVDKTNNSANKPPRRSKSKTPPVRRRKSNSSERKYYTVGSTQSIPNRPPRKKSYTSLTTLNSLSKRSRSSDITQYVEIDDTPTNEINKNLISGEVVNKMKDRPLPPPPRPPRGPKRKSQDDGKNDESQELFENEAVSAVKSEDIIEVEVSTQTDPLPDDVDYELGFDEHFDVSMSSSLKDIISEEHINKSLTRLIESPRNSRPASRSEKSYKISDPKISELSKSNLGRTSPTVILVEKRVSSPTRINERDEILTEASLTVQHIDVDESQIADLPPLPAPRGNSVKSSMKEVSKPDDQALEAVNNTNAQIDTLITRRLQVSDLEVGRLNVTELQANKISVSDIEGMTLQVSELDSKSGHISVSGIEFSQNVIDEIVKKFTELASPSILSDESRHREEQTQTEQASEDQITPVQQNKDGTTETNATPPQHTESTVTDNSNQPPQRPPPPDLTPLLYSYLQDLSMPTGSLYHIRPPRDRLFTEFHESQHQSPPSTMKRGKRKQPAPHSDSSSDDDRPRPSPRRMPQTPSKSQDPSIAEAGAQFIRICHSSISRTMRHIFDSFMSYISGTEDKKDVQMALVILLVLIAGLIMFGLSDSRTVHHHHWEFFNPPEGKP